MGEPTKSDAPAGSEADGTLTDSLLREVARVAEVPIAGPDADLTRTRIGRYRVTGLTRCRCYGARRPVVGRLGMLRGIWAFAAFWVRL
jgi:hypothetical protein